MPDLTVSIVIPVYNEEDYLPACLEAISKQTVMPMEVIIVDNNCSDKTVEIARQYSFVRVIKEPRQGVVFASFTGYSNAKGDIYGRIDADSIIGSDWVEKVINEFKKGDTDALSGRLTYYDLVLPFFFNWVDKTARKIVTARLRETAILQGCNMAVSKKAWALVKDEVHLTNEVQDETDFAIHLSNKGAKIAYSPNMVAGVSVRRVRLGFIEGFRYYKMLPRTYKMHKVKQAWLFYFVVMLIVSLYVPLRVSHELYLINHRKSI